jgi:S1-C subfamily serine protease
MKARTLLVGALLVGAFVYFTSGWGPRWARDGRAAGPGGQIWSGPDVVRSAGLSADELNNIEIYQTANTATVNITTVVYRQDWFFNIVPERGSGSGFLVDGEGRILTNHHVTQGGRSKIMVTLSDGTKLDAELLTADPDNDLALIQVSSRKKLPFLRLGSSEDLKVGQKVLAIGNPFGFEGTLTTGVISSLGRSVRADADTVLEDMIQTDAAINPGNSGGPLLNSQGVVIGINTAIYGPGGNIGIGFAMPIERAKIMLDEYARKGYFARPSLGARVLYLPPNWAEALNLPAQGGLLVLNVDRQSNAAAAGLRGATRRVVVGSYEIPYGGDFILEIDARPVEDKNSLRRALSRKRAGDPLELLVFREGQTRKVTVRLEERSEQAL